MAILYGKVNLGGGSSKNKGLAPNNVSNIMITPQNKGFSITWQDPDNIIVNGQTLSTWKGTKVVYKTNGFPKNVNDGTLAINSRVKNQYKDNACTITGLANNTVYYVQLFPYSTTGLTNEDNTNRIMITTPNYKTMTAVIDQTNSNPDTCITYQDDAVNMVAKSSAWDEFFNCKPCLFKDGEVVKYLNPDNFAQFEDGTEADITSGDAGDVMIEIPRMGLKITNQNDNTITVSITNYSNDSDFKYYAHNKGETAKDKLYVGAYLGYNLNNKIRSLSGKTPSASISYANYLTYCEANGTGYDMISFYAITLLQAMFILKYKSLNSQTALGTGSTATMTTGGANAKGMNYGESTGSQQMKVFGIEDLWGGLWQWVAGLFINGSNHILTATNNFNSTGNGYTDTGSTSRVDGLMSKAIGTTEAGFLPKQVSASVTTYYCDKAATYGNSFGQFGWESSTGMGIFDYHISRKANSSAAWIGGRMMYL